MSPDALSETAAATARRGFFRIPEVLQGREFRRFWAGETISLFGDQITLLALPLVGVLTLHASAAEMGYLGAAALLPNLLFSLHAGAWVDRRGRRRQTMLATALGRAGLLATIPLAYLLGLLTMTQLYVVSFLVGTLSVLFMVSYSTLFVSLVPRERYVEASSLLNGSRAMSTIAGPSIGGLLVQALSAPGAILADALSFLASALSLRSISPVEPPTEEAEHGHLRAGIRYLWRVRIMRYSLLATATLNFFNFIFWALVLLYITRTLGVRPGVLGLVIGAASVGGLIGSVLTGRIGRRMGVGPTFVLGCVLFPAPLVLVPLASGTQWTIIALLFAAEFFSGFGVMLLDISGNSIMTAVIPDRLRARVAGAHMVVNYGVRPLGALLGGALGTWIGVRPTLLIGAVGGLLGVLWLAPSPLLRMHDLPEVDEGVA
ncbi:MAG TPA: MFS transporter [Gaiellaceae bacterium]|nr:MFS transporter [Gaiellaceae bacterium]